MEEIWKVYTRPCVNKQQLWEISNLGNVKKNGVPYKLSEHLGYYTFRHSTMLHRVVAELFIPNPENKPCVEHIDADKHNNKVSNLRWATYKENNNNPITRKRMSESSKGQIRSKESIEKYRLKRIGYKHSKETKLKMSLSAKGRHRVYREDGTWYMTYENKQ